MANPKHLTILEQGVEVWNKWRKNHPHAKIDLKGADLSKINLSKINFSKAFLNRANFRYVNFIGADLTEANLTESNLTSAYLRKASLIKAIFKKANLAKANFCEAMVRDANFRGAYLGNASLMNADLIRADFNNADLSNANLMNADLSGANFRRANFENANLSETNLRVVQAIATNFTGVMFTGSCIEDWNINSQTNLENVICDYIYLKYNWWNQDKQKYEFIERRPSNSNRNFEPGEFAKLVQKSIETVDLIFKDGIDWKAFLSSYQDIQVEYGNENVSIQAIEKKSDGAFVIRLNVPPEANKAEIERKVIHSYETRLKVLEAQYRIKLDAKDDQIAIYRQHNTSLENIVGTLAGRPTQNIIDITNTAESKSMSDTFNNDLKGANIANFANQLEGNARQQANQNIYASEQKQTLAEAADEIQKLLKHGSSCIE